MEKFFKDFKNYKMKIEGKSENTTNQYIYRIQSFLEYKKGKDVYNDRYTIRFKDGKIAKNIMSCELDFDYWYE